MSVLPGDTLHIIVRNNLKESPETSKASVPDNDADSIPCAHHNCTTIYGSKLSLPDATNLHAHGLHVSPDLGSDDTLDSHMDANHMSEYTIRIPLDHMAGLFWYHPHGSTIGGCAGAIVIREPTPLRKGVPTWLKDVPTDLIILQQLTVTSQRDDLTFVNGHLPVCPSVSLSVSLPAFLIDKQTD